MDRTMTDFAIGVFCQVNLPNSREVIYRDYVDFCAGRNVEPLSLSDFCREFRGMIRKAMRSLGE